MMKSCSMTNAVFFACRINLAGGLKAALQDEMPMNVPFDNLARDDTLFRVEETVVTSV
jgi:hypothetical protein